MDILRKFCYLNEFIYKKSRQIFLPDTLCTHQSPLLSKNMRSAHNLFETDTQQPELECACTQAKTVEKNKVPFINGHVFPLYFMLFLHRSESDLTTKRNTGTLPFLLSSFGILTSDVEINFFYLLLYTCHVLLLVMRDLSGLFESLPAAVSSC